MVSYDWPDLRDEFVRDWRNISAIKRAVWQGRLGGAASTASRPNARGHEEIQPRGRSRTRPQYVSRYRPYRTVPCRTVMCHDPWIVPTVGTVCQRSNAKVFRQLRQRNVLNPRISLKCGMQKRWLRAFFFWTRPFINHETDQKEDSKSPPPTSHVPPAK